MKTGEQLIEAERARQIAVCGHTHGHDDSHRDGSLAAAGRCYIATAKIQIAHGKPLPGCFIHKDWPWDRQDWNPDRINAARNLEKGGALIQAEVERLRRKYNGAYLVGEQREIDPLEAEVKFAAAEIDTFNARQKSS